MMNLQLMESNRELKGKAVVDRYSQSGDRLRVRFQGSYWFARANPLALLSPGESVRVVGRQNLTLLVEKIWDVEGASISRVNEPVVF
jgi:membrane protein implicated in regulation of membrane protease activity